MSISPAQRKHNATSLFELNNYYSFSRRLHNRTINAKHHNSSVHSFNTFFVSGKALTSQIMSRTEIQAILQTKIRIQSLEREEFSAYRAWPVSMPVSCIALCIVHTYAINVNNSLCNTFIDATFDMA